MAQADGHLVLVGAGHAHLEVLRQFARARPSWRVTLVTLRARSAYSGMLPGVLLGRLPPEEALIAVAPLAAAAGAELVIDEACAIEPEARRLTLASGRRLAWDLLSLDTGSAPSPAMPRDGRWLSVRPLDDFLAQWQAAEAALPARAEVAILGAGAAGVEIALSLAGRFRRDRRPAAIRLVERAGEILPGFPPGFRARMRRECLARGIRLETGAAGPPPEADLGIWLAGATAPGWLAAAGLATDAGGFARVDVHLRSISHPHIFAAGDVASIDGAPRPKAGVFAVRQGPVLAANLVRAIAGRRLRRYRPQRAWLTLMALDERQAVAVRNGIWASGGWVWRWKDHIDRRFVARYRAG
jgi:selenide,water dikinase